MTTQRFLLKGVFTNSVFVRFFLVNLMWIDHMLRKRDRLESYDINNKYIHNI